MIKKLIPLFLALAAMFCIVPMRGDTPPDEGREIPIRKVDNSDLIRSLADLLVYYDNYIHPMMMLNVQESFACGVAWHLTKKVHSGYVFDYDNYTYTGIVEDMIDNDGHKADDESIPEYVSGYSIQEVEDAVYGAWTYAMWKNNLDSLYSYNPTREYLEDLFFNVW